MCLKRILQKCRLIIRQSQYETNVNKVMVINHSIFTKYFLTTHFVPDPTQGMETKAVSEAKAPPSLMEPAA